MGFNSAFKGLSNRRSCPCPCHEGMHVE